MYLAAVGPLLGSVALGMTLFYSSPALPDMEKSNMTMIIDKEDATWIGSLSLLGALFGSMAGGPLSNLIGRRGLLLHSSLPLIAGWLFIFFANSVVFIFVGRIITGFCGGLISVSGPIYLVEISTPEVRGRLGSAFQLASSIGIFLSSSLGAILSWYWLALASSAVPLILLMMMLNTPESPRWLALKKRRLEAIDSISILKGPKTDPYMELKAIETVISQLPEGNLKFKDFIKPAVLKPFVLSILLVFFQQCSGIMPMTSYTTSIIQQTGSLMNPVYATVIVTGIQTVTLIITCAILDKVGRKVLLIISGFFMALSQSAIGIFVFLSDQDNSVNSTYSWIPMLCVILYLASYAIGFGPIPFLMVAEMTPLKARGIVQGITCSLCYTIAFVISKLFETMKLHLNHYGIYWLYGFMCYVSIFFTWFMLPETKGKPLGDMQHIFATKDNKLNNNQEIKTGDQKCNTEDQVVLTMNKINTKKFQELHIEQ